MKRPWVFCKDCELPYSDDGWADFVVNDDLWRKITEEDGAGILCVNCIIRRTVRIGIDRADGRFTSGPFNELNRSTG